MTTTLDRRSVAEVATDEMANAGQVKGKPNYLADAQRSAKENRAIIKALRIIEQRTREMTSIAKMGVLCEHADDKRHALKRIAELSRQTMLVSEQLCYSAIERGEDPVTEAESEQAKTVEVP